MSTIPSSIRFTFTLIKQIILGIPKIIKNLILCSTISAIIGSILHIYLLGWVNDGFTPGKNPILNSIILSTGNEFNPRVLIFYFLINYLIWWTIRTTINKGFFPTLISIISTPVWIIKNVGIAGLGSFPQLVFGISISFILGMTILTQPTSLTLMVTTITILISQDQSVSLYLLRLFHRDMLRISGSSSETPLPPVHIASNQFLGLLMGLSYILFIQPNISSTLLFIALSVTTLIYMAINERKAAKTLMLLFIVALFIPMAYCDDVGIRENGGVRALTDPVILTALLENSEPAALAGAIGAMIYVLSSELTIPIENVDLEVETTSESDMASLTQSQISENPLSPPFPILETVPPELPSDGVMIASIRSDVLDQMIEWSGDTPVITTFLENIRDAEEPEPLPDSAPEYVRIDEDQDLFTWLWTLFSEGRESGPSLDDLEHAGGILEDNSPFGSGGGVTQAIGGGINSDFIDQVEDEMRSDAAVQGLRWLRAGTAMAQGSTRTGGGTSTSRHQMPGINSPLGPSQAITDGARAIGTNPNTVRSLEGVASGVFDLNSPDVKNFIDWMKIHKKDSIGHQSYIRFMETYNRLPDTSDPSDVEGFRNIYQGLKTDAELNGQ